MSTDMQRWSDAAMFRSESHDASVGPLAHLLAGPGDPLGQIAACALMYTGVVVRDLADITDEQRRHYLEQIQKTKLAMPLEAVSLHFMFENVTRAFTHQLVRQRTAAYAQESMRFAVVEDMTEAVALPPSLAGTLPIHEWLAKEDPSGYFNETEDDFVEKYASESQKARFQWDAVVDAISHGYNALVNMGMPAEDARGLMPTNIITRINYLTNFRGLLDHAGNRLCTQAQAEWRTVFAKIAQAMVKHGEGQTYRVKTADGTLSVPSGWQWEALAQVLRPVCYQTGRCAFKADFDRYCSIRARVDANSEINRPSSEWGEDFVLDSSVYYPKEGAPEVAEGREGQIVHIGAIHTREWLLDPNAARAAR